MTKKIPTFTNEMSQSIRIRTGKIFKNKNLRVIYGYFCENKTVKPVFDISSRTPNLRIFLQKFSCFVKKIGRFVIRKKMSRTHYL